MSRQRVLLSICMVAVFVIWVAAANAVPVPVIGASGELTTPSLVESYDVGGGSTIDIGSAQGGGPIQIFYNPNAGPWQKIFGNFVAPLTINEAIQIAAGGPNWTDWEEQILTPGWVWAGGGSLSILGDGTYNGTLSADQQTVSFLFPAQGVGTNLIINKVLQWNGQGLPQMPVTINQWPTVPEPSTVLMLLMAGICGMTLWRRIK